MGKKKCNLVGISFSDKDQDLNKYFGKGIPLKEATKHYRKLVEWSKYDNGMIRPKKVAIYCENEEKPRKSFNYEAYSESTHKKWNKKKGV